TIAPLSQYASDTALHPSPTRRSSDLRHELESQIEPFKGLLLGLFFIAVGMGIDLDRIAAEPLLIAGGVGLLLVVKFGVLLGIGKVARLQPGHSLLLGGTLWLGGEFAFVVFHEALRVRLLTDRKSVV